MIRRLHRLAPWMVAIAMMAAGLTIGASAAGEGASQGGIITSWAEWIVGNVIALVGGLIAWTQLTLRGVRNRIAEALALHDSNEEAHHAASAHNHVPINADLSEVRILLESINQKVNTLVDGQKIAVEELGEQDVRIGNIENALQRLWGQHEAIHGDSLPQSDGAFPCPNRRATDRPRHENIQE